MRPSDLATPVAALAAVILAGCGSTPPERPTTPPPVLESTLGLPPVVQTSVGLDLLLVPPGLFKMGSSGGPGNERPAHHVRITRPYYLGRTEVTQAQFAQFVAETGHVTTAEREGGTKVWRGKDWVVEPNANYKNVFPGEERPVVGVSWDDAVAFCAWLTERERRERRIGPTQVIRLPTEAEWERAARAGTPDRFAGTDDPDQVCRYGNAPDAAAAREGLGRETLSCDDGVGVGTAPVGRYLPNALGLYDMTGNVWEWVADRYGPYLGAPQNNPEGPVGGSQRVMRGGSWSGKLHSLEVSHREGYPPALNGGAIGFRVALNAR